MITTARPKRETRVESYALVEIRWARRAYAVAVRLARNEVSKARWTESEGAHLARAVRSRLLIVKARTDDDHLLSQAGRTVLRPTQ